NHSITAMYSGDDCYNTSTSDKLAQVVSDQNPPTVTVLSPNGGEILVVGAPTKITWTASDDKLVTSVDILLSRDNGATYPEVLASNDPNDGNFNWIVTAPGSNIGATPVFDAFIKIRAHDAAANTGEDISDAPFS